ncbi:MAG: zinc dependent phospholipase C family protein [Desulfuromonadaceae bacterium]|nr:zinc dependent phospholipase C family protein [Desulfuromonadaceae bacterium]
MPGPYAHITLLHELMRPGTSESLFNSSAGFLDALEQYFPYCVLGAVSPDYPNLARHDDTAAWWADAMHCTRTGEMIASGVRRLNGTAGAVHDKQLAWLLGYCAHVATDVTIHPVVQAKVGAYAENQRHHRVCEMNQDSHIYRRMNLGEIGASDAFARIVAQCSDADDATRLDRDIVTFWEGMFGDVYPHQFVKYPPNSASWHREFVAKAADCRAGEARLFPLASVIAAKMGGAYPAYKTVDRQYIEEQMVPSDPPCLLHYDKIFDHALENVAKVWRLVEQAVCAADPAYMHPFEEWNLDTGRDEHDRLVFW